MNLLKTYHNIPAHIGSYGLPRISGFLVVLMVIIFASPVFAQNFTINKFHSDITIQDDSSFIVKETINVHFPIIRHGIYREIPFRYTDELGSTTKTPLKILSVTDELGKDLKFTVSKTGNVINIKIGDPTRYVIFNKTYVISYRVENAILFFDDHDELYWNVTGNYWQAPIKEASASVTLAVKEKSKNLWTSCYTGASGSKESLCGFKTYANSGDFFTKKNFNAGEGLTIAFGWNKGLVAAPSLLEKILWALNIEENWVFLFPFISLIFMITLWAQKGRDPKVRESVTVMYEPPKYNNKPLTPAEVGTLIDEELDPRDITSTIVGLAVKGYIKIEETKKGGLVFDSSDYYLSKIKEPDQNLTEFERILMAGIFSGASGTHVSEMKNRFYTNLGLLKTALYKELVNKKYFLINPEKIRNLYLIAGIAVAVAVAVLGGVAYAVFIPYTGLKNIFAGILSGLPVVVFSKMMPAKTRAGASAYMDIRGFQEFLNRAEKDRLEKIGDKDLFSKFLPYAIALDVGENWAKAFEGIYQNPPEWYVSPVGYGTFSPYGFSRSINSVSSSLASAMFSAPRGSGTGGDSGFGGGGSSGGGFGGGGGRSW